MQFSDRTPIPVCYTFMKKLTEWLSDNCYLYSLNTEHTLSIAYSIVALSVLTWQHCCGIGNIVEMVLFNLAYTWGSWDV